MLGFHLTKPLFCKYCRYFIGHRETTSTFNPDIDKQHKKNIFSIKGLNTPQLRLLGISLAAVIANSWYRPKSFIRSLVMRTLLIFSNTKNNLISPSFRFLFKEVQLQWSFWKEFSSWDEIDDSISIVRCEEY